ANETSVGAVVASGPIQPLAYTITEGNTGNAFAIDSSNGLITVMNSSMLDYETTSSYTLTVAVSDGMNTVSAVITINIIDVNEQVLTVKDQEFSVDENSADNTPVGTVVASGPVEPLTYSITAGNTGDAFAIDSETGVIRVLSSDRLDYETISKYELTVQVSDGALLVEALITITLNDLSEHKPVAENAEFSVDENSAGDTIVGKVTASDADKDTLTYSITTGNTGDAFAINTGNGTIRVSSLLDYETISAYTLTVAVSDGMNTVSAVITINIIDVNEQVLTVKDQEFSVDENSADNTPVGTVVASGPIEPLVYSITAGNTGEAFVINSETGVITVRNSAQLDYETTSEYELTVQVSDGTAVAEALITITLSDLSEHKPVAENAEFSVDENSVGGTVVGKVTASDADTKDTLTYSITAGNTGDVFAIDSETGEITVNSSTQLDYEATEVYTLTVQVSDNINTATALITVNINDVSEDILVVNDQTFQVDENSANGTSVGRIAASGPVDTLTFSITAGNNTGNVFVVDSAAREIRVDNGSMLDYETQPVYTLTLEISDGITTVTPVITINVNDLGEYVPVASDQTFQADENSYNGTIVGTVAASDDDPADILAYRITAGNTGNAFAIDNKTGEITVKDGVQLDYETTPEYVLTVAVSDGTNTITIAVTVMLNDLPEDVLVVKDQAFSVNEDSPEGTSVGKVVASGPAGTLAYLITAGNTDNAFTINGSTGEIILSSSPDYETTPIYVLTVEVSDSISTVSAAITINVVPDAESHKPVTEDQVFSVDESSAAGTFVGVVIATDPDPGDILTYTITAGNEDNAFAIDSQTGVITVSSEQLPDYDTMPVYILTIEVSDGENNADARITVNVLFPLMPDMAWHNPVPTGNTLAGVWGTGGSVFAVGDSGTILYHNGADWSTMENPSFVSLYDVWGTSDTDVFAVGHAGMILHYDGNNWTSMNSGTTETLNAVWGRTGADVFAVGNAGTILHYNGAEWIPMYSATALPLSGIWGDSETVVTVGNSGTILFYDGTEWFAEESGVTENLKGIWGTSGSDLFVAGDGGIILRYDGTNWNKPDTPTDENLMRVWGSSGTDVFAAGEYGVVIHYDGTAWHEMESRTESWIFGLWGDIGSNVFAVGYAGLILRYNGTDWTFKSKGSYDWLKGIWGSSDSDIFAVGGGFDYYTLQPYRTILHYNGASWNSIVDENSDYLYGIWGSSESDIFAVGGTGLILHYDGSEWSTVNSGITEELYSIWGSSGSDIFAVGDMGVILHYNGTEWMETRTGEPGFLSDVWGSSGSDVFAVGSGGMVIHYDGTGWKEMDSSVNTYLYAVCGTSGNNVFAAGDAGTILHYNGTEWMQMETDISEPLVFRDISINSEDVFVAGDNGTILYYNGTEWRKVNVNTHNHFKSVWYATDSIFVVGDTGTILEIGK
ncbi:MAG: hypothetical protein GY795_21975, partial [Desulfobacterales bacterium]|nr:hypothetical protein [Desulfobacterales bacterium]